MKVLDLRFKVDDLTADGRPFEGVLSEELLAACLPGLVGELGYRVESQGTVTGSVYLSHGGEVIVDGQVSTRVGFDCTRCLSSRSVDISIRQSHTLIERDGPSEGKQEIVLSNDDADDLDETYEGDDVDLTELFRQDLVLALPMNPSCALAGATDCAYVENAHQTEEERIDPRWAPLLELKKKLN